MAVTARKRDEPRSQAGIGQFLRDVYDELRKVVWPTPEQLTRLTALVIALSVAMGFALGGVDYLFTELFRIAVAGAGS